MHVTTSNRGKTTPVIRFSIPQQNFQLSLPIAARSTGGKSCAQVCDVAVCLFGGFSFGNAAANARVDSLLILTLLLPTYVQPKICRTEAGINLHPSEDNSPGLIVLPSAEVNVPCHRIREN